MWGEQWERECEKERERKRDEGSKIRWRKER